MNERQEGPVPSGHREAMDEVLNKVRGLRLKNYTRDECLMAAEGAPFSPDQCQRLGEMLYMRSGRGDMSIEDLMQRLFPVGDSVVASAGGQTKTVLCTDCFDDDGDQEVLTPGHVWSPCVGCGRSEGPRGSGPAFTLYRRDPRPAELQALASQTAAVLAPHEQRVVQEALELNERLEKLTAFVSGQVFTGLDDTDRRLLLRQHGAMTELAFVLATRIQRFKGAAS